MNLKCALGFHRWNGCKCVECANTRDEGHDWSADCEKCARCGTERESPHNWSGCKCAVCRKVRDEGHDWSKDCEDCPQCGKRRTNSHTWSGCKCSKCGKTRAEGHDWSDGEKCPRCGQAPVDILLNTGQEASQLALVKGIKSRRSLAEIAVSAADFERISFRVRAAAIFRMSEKCELCHKPLRLPPSSGGTITLREMAEILGFCPTCQTVMCLGCGGIWGIALAATGKRSMQGTCPKCKATLAP